MNKKFAGCEVTVDKKDLMGLPTLDPQFQKNWRMTQACITGDKESLRKALAEGADVNVPMLLNAELPKMQALHVACTHENAMELVEILCEYKADVNHASNCGQTPLAMASILDRTDLCRLLVKHGAELDRRMEPLEFNALCYAAKNAKVGAVRTLIELGAKVDDGPGVLQPIHVAAGSGAREVVEVLLANGASLEGVDGANWNVMHFAAAAGELAMGKFLACLGVPHSTSGRGYNKRNEIVNPSPLDVAIDKQQIEFGAWLVSVGASEVDVDGKGHTPIQRLLLTNGGLGRLVQWLEGGGDVNVQSSVSGHSALHQCVQFHVSSNQDELLECAAYLLEAGIDTSLVDRDGRTAQALARSQGRSSMEGLIRAHAARQSLGEVLDGLAVRL